MPSMQEMAHSLHSTLSATLEHMAALEAVEEKLHNARTQLMATTGELVEKSKMLAAAKVELKQTEDTLAKKLHIINDEKARALRDIDEQIKARIEEMKKLDLKISEKRAEHDNILAGMDSLYGRLRTGRV
jgi:chromosome segregation ATPase